MRKPHVRAKTTVEVHRLCHVHSLARVLVASDDGSVSELGNQIRSHCVRMLEPYIREQTALVKAQRERRNRR